MLYFNELSLHGQFASSAALETALRQVLALRQMAMDAGLGLHVKRFVPQRLSIGKQELRAGLRTINRELQRAVSLWLDRDGPFWEDSDRHSDNAWFECGAEIITESGLAEAADRRLRGVDAATAGLHPSDWQTTPLPVVFDDGKGGRINIAVPNHVEAKTMAPWLAVLEKAPDSWSGVRDWALRRCRRLYLADNVMESLSGHPFMPGAAERVQELLLVLNRLASLVELEGGGLTQEGVSLLQTHFVGEKAWFSDSSDGEKSGFREELTFPHPTRTGEKVFATWHGKVKIGQLRIHYVHEFRSSGPVYVVYIGPKITRR
jgi:hypothetical protein